MTDLFANLANIGLPKLIGLAVVIGLLVYAFIPKKGNGGSGNSTAAPTAKSNDNTTDNGGQ